MPATLDHFEIPAADVERLSAFLAEVFGWPAEKSSGDSDHPTSADPTAERYVRLRASEGEPGGAVLRVGLYQGPREVLDRALPVVRVTDEILESCLERVTAAGGRVLLEPKSFGDGSRFARFEDPEGNPWGLWQSPGDSGVST